MQNKVNMQEFVIDLLKKDTPSAYSFHNFEHTLYVQCKATALARELGLSAHDVDLISAAALWHDAGYISIYKGHEEESCELAKQYLPGFGFKTADIESICGMIMATKIPQKPYTLQEQILADADLEYLATTDAPEKADALFRELQSLNENFSREEWNKQQVDFIASHQYFTKPYQDTKEPLKNIYLSQLMKEV